MKLLLTSGGIRNASIRKALVDLLGKPIEEASALFIPTALHPLPGGTHNIYLDIVGGNGSFCDAGWKSVGVLELTALPSVKRELWLPGVQAVDALLVGGGDPLYLVHWMRGSGLAELLPSLRSEAVYVGLSAGSMVAGPDVSDETYGGVDLPQPDPRGLSLVECSIFPHLNYPGWSGNTTANAERVAAKWSWPTYAIDDDTAIRVVDGAIDVVSEGEWQRFGV